MGFCYTVPMTDDDIKKEADIIIEEFKQESDKISGERKKALSELRKALEEEKVKEIKNSL